MKIGIIGMGWVGSSVAISTLQSGVATELLVRGRSEMAPAWWEKYEKPTHPG